MKLMVTGHRLEKLQSYDIEWIEEEVRDQVALLALYEGLSLGLSGMASGVDLWFCGACYKSGVPYHACVPFDGQEELMDPISKVRRAKMLEHAAEIKNVRNRYMVENCEAALVVWDGNKGGTHNCFQQLLETNKKIYWIIPPRKQMVVI